MSESSHSPGACVTTSRDLYVWGSAASGKLGAAIGSYSFGALIDSGLGLQGTFLVTSGVTLLLLLTTSLFVPRYGQRTLGALEGCDGATAVALLYAPRRGS